MYQVEALRISQSRLAGRCGTAEPVQLAVYTSARQNTRRAWRELLKSQCSLATHRYLRCEATVKSFLQTAASPSRSSSASGARCDLPVGSPAREALVRGMSSWRPI